MQTIDDLRDYLAQNFGDAKVYLFGSRARGTASEFSDVDIAIESDAPLDEPLTLAREAIENSLIPYKVDLVDLSKTPYLKTVIQREGIRWH